MLKLLHTGRGRSRAVSVLTISIAVLAAGCVASPVAYEQAEAGIDAASQRALEYLPDQESVYWTEPSTQRTSRVMVLETLPFRDGQPCRLLLVEATAGTEGSIERYCRQADSGIWLWDGRAIEAGGVRAPGTEPPTSR